jgi:pimeloyl-ACP methyl ester carboxylesterase
MKSRKYGLSTIVLLMIATILGCGQKESGPVVTQEQAVGETRTAQYKTLDGWMIQGDLYEPQTDPKGLVILLHQRGGSADDWHPLALALKQAGYMALAIDQRGTGRSTNGPGQTGELAPWNTTGDIEGGLLALKAKWPAIPAMVVGASYGANNALLYATAHPDQVRSLVLFSPSTDYHGLDTTEAIKTYHGPLLIFHQKNDKIAGNGPATLNSTSGSKDHKLEVHDGSGHGTALLNAATTQETVDFITRTLK